MFDLDGAGRAAAPGWMPMVAALHRAQWRNLAALLAAQRTAATACRDVSARLLERGTMAVAEGRDRVEAMQGAPMDAASAARAVAEAGRAAERALAELRVLSGMLGAATAEACAILRARADEAVAELTSSGRPRI